MRAIIVLATAAVMMMTIAPALCAAQKASKQEIIKKEKRLEDVRKQIREQKKGIKEIAEKETNILGEMDRINRDLSGKREELKKIKAVHSDIQKNVASANSNISRLERDRRSYAARLTSRLKAMYKMRRGEAMELVFTSGSAIEAGRRHKYLTVIMDNDSNIIEGLERSITGLATEKKRLGGLLAEARSAKKSVEAAQAEAERLYRERVALLNDVKGEKDRRQKVVDELEQAARELTDLLGKLRSEDGADSTAGEASGFASMMGKLPMPVEGHVVSFYGKVRHPKFQTVTFNNGIVIEAPIGASVKSVYEGKVVYVGWLKGYGQVMIMDHRGGYYTLFAYLSKALKEKGDEVGKGAEIALVGDTGPQATAGLYFEIRQKGVPRDPLSWVAEK